jgi:hypothetical protein
MVDSDKRELGVLMQQYARCWWEGSRDREAADRLGTRLGRDLRDRIDVLGIDIERLLAVDPARAPAELETLEKEAALENAAVPPAIARLGAGKERHPHAQAENSRSDTRMRSGGYYEPARYGRHRQRSER